MATEFSLAVARFDKKRCQDRLMSGFDIIVDASDVPENVDENWDFGREATRRNIYCWSTQTTIDTTIDGIPGNESYVSVPKAIDLVLGMIHESNAEDHVLDTNMLRKEVEWNMDMQAQEWTVSGNNWMAERPKVQSVFGDIYAQPHHFETLNYLKMPIERQRCVHDNHRIFNENVFSSLHHIVHNTIYLIDMSYKIIVQDQKPYRYPLGLIREYKTTRQLEEWKATNYYTDGLITQDYNGYNNANKVIYVKDGNVVDEAGGSEIPHAIKITKVLRADSVDEGAFVRRECDVDYDEVDSRLVETPAVAYNPRSGDVQVKTLTFRNNKLSVTCEQHGIEEIDATGADEVYVKMMKRGNETIRDEVIKYTNVRYTESGTHTIGYGPLTVEGEVNPKVLEQWRRDETMKDFVDFLYWDSTKRIDPNKLCHLFADYSRKHPSANVRYIEDNEVCAKFRLTLNALFNNGEDRARVANGFGEGWTVDPVDIEAFANIDKFSQPVYKKNPAKLGIVIASIMGGIVTESCPIHTIRGAFLLANKMYGNVFNLLEDTFQWRIWVAERRPGWVKRKTEKISPLVRFDVYRSSFKKGWSGVSWQFYWSEGVSVKADSGYPFFREEIDNSCWFEEDRVIVFHQNMINAEKWGDVHTEIDDLLNDQGRFRNKSILDDFYLDKYKVLVTPWYYGVKIYYNVIANCCYKCVPVTAHEATPINKNQFKHSGGQRLLVPNNWFYPFQDQFDEVVICEGNSLSNVRQLRGRLERTYVDTIARNSEFRDYVGKSEVDIIDTGCPITYTTSYVIWLFYMRLFNTYVNYFPIEMRKRYQKINDSIPVFPNMKVYRCGFSSEIKSLNEAVYQLLIEAYGAKDLKIKDRNVWIKRYQSCAGEARLKLIKDAAPLLYTQLMGDAESLDNYFVVNFLLLLATTSTNVALDEDIYTPICYCVDGQPSLFSVKLVNTRKSNILSQFIGYLTRFFGLTMHERWNNTDDAMRILRRKAVDFYIGRCVVNLTPDILIRQTKHQNMNLWIGTKCDGFSDVLIFYQAITHPDASYFVVCLCTSNVNLVALKVELSRILSESVHTSTGCVIIRIERGRVFDVHVSGDMHVRELRRNFWGLNHDVVLIKSKGRVFGNKHLVTKLMNIQP
uniref:Outer capsid protein VP2 n=1 Tax=Changuinola virus TaxID=40052 RepID=U5YIA5_9REOV|nr:outer capsid protein VP2 [Changuinola virus]